MTQALYAHMNNKIKQQQQQQQKPINLQTGKHTQLECAQNELLEYRRKY
jgi:hypothetical protein